MTLLALLEVGGVGSAFFLGESTQIGFKFIVCVVIINKNKRYPLLLRELLWLKRSSGVGCLYCYSVFTETRRAVFQEAAPGPGLWAPLPSLPACHPPTSSRSADGDQASFSAITADPPHSHPTSDSVVAPSSLLLPSSSREALSNQKQLCQTVNSRLISNTKRCSMPFILLPRLSPALGPLHPTPAHTPAFWIVAYPRKVIPQK